MKSPRDKMEQHIMTSMGGIIATRIFDETPERGIVLLRTCIHESGHGALRLIFGLPLSAVTIAEKDGNVRATTWGGTLPQDEHPRVSDVEHIKQRAGYIADLAKTPCDLPGLEAETERLLRENWTGLMRVARALFSRSTCLPVYLPGGAIRRIFYSDFPFQQMNKGEYQNAIS